MLQRASYRVEADLLGARTLPALKETPRQLRALGRGSSSAPSRATRLVGAVSWKRDRPARRHPPPRRRTPTASAAASPARCSTRSRSTSPTPSGLIVATGAANPPARRLYERRGFAPVEERVVDGSITIVTYERRTARHDARRVRRRPAHAPDAGRPCPRHRRADAATPRRAPVEAARARLPRRSPRCRCSARRTRPTTRGRGSSGAARSRTSTSARSAARRGSRCRCSSRRLLALRRRRGARTCGCVDRARRRLPGDRDGLPARLAARRLAGGRDRRASRCCSPTATCARSGAATPRASSSRVCLWAIERHLDGRRADAFLLGFAAALLRPEVWPFFGLYGLWLAWVEPRRRAARARRASRANGFLWFAPEYWGSGDWLRAANRAHQPNPDSAAFADRPFLEVFRRSSAILSLPVLLGALLALVERRSARGAGTCAARCSPPPAS